MKKILQLLVTSFVFSILIACGNSSITQSEPEVNISKAGEGNILSTSVDAFSPSARSGVNSQSALMKPRILSNATKATVIVLSAPREAQLDSTNTNTSEYATGKPLQIGFARQVAQTASITSTKQTLQWKASASGGKVAAISISSTNAKGLRIGLMVHKLPVNAVLRLYSKNTSSAFEFSGAEVLALLARNASAGDVTEAGKTFWGPLIEGDESTVEIEIPVSVSTEDVNFSIPSISHNFMSLSQAGDIVSQTTYSSPNFGLVCEVDVSCTTPLPAASNAVALLDYVNNGSEYICSGTLLNDSINSSTPYVLSANHCISDQITASTLYTLWFYRSSACNATNGNFTIGTLGSTLLYTAYNTDSTLLRLSSAPPVGALFAGWDAAVAPALSTAVTNIHHPEGDAQRISRGTVTGYFTRSPTSLATFLPSNIENSTILEVALTSGLTEKGSNGSGLFKGTNVNPQLIGQLFGGPTPSCSNTAVRNVYGRFDVAFNSGMSDWLQQGNKGVSRFYNTASGTHFYTISASEANYIKATFSSFSFEGLPFKASTVTGSGLSPVYRFYNLSLGVHFYTISASERAFVIANLPQMRDEGVAWYANTVSAAGTIPLYRFYNRDKGVHFYTVSASERASVIANLPQMNDEGIAYYVQP
jgi:hypothetical protein